MQKHKLYVLIWILLIIQYTTATPKFNSVNEYDNYGNKCPLPTYNAYPCPELCVRDISLCPVNSRPVCPTGTTYCIDGTCRTICPDETLTSACACPGSPALVGKIYRCGSNALQVNIPEFVVENKANLSAIACARAANLTSVSTWTPNPALIMWHECPVPNYGQLTFTENVFIALYVFYGTCFMTLVTWIFYKKIRERESNQKNEETRNEPRTLNKESLDHSDKSTVKEEEEEGMNVIAFKNCWFGRLIMVLFSIETIGQIGYMIMVTQDYYTGYSAFRGISVVATSTFMGMWYILFFWFASLTLFRHRLPNFFRIKCSYQEGQYVQIERKEPVLIFLQGQSNPIMKFVRLLEHQFKHWTGMDVVISHTSIQYTSSGTKYFIYQCTRYVYHSKFDIFAPHQFHLGQRHAQLASLTEGLSSHEAAVREELIGPNFIEVYVPNFFLAMFREFASFFYIYQFSVLWLFYYLDYWQVGIADTAVILVSAFVKVIVRLRSEKRIKAMAEFTDQVKILRDGLWQDMSTAHLLPGDLFEIQEGKMVPCDAVILSGNIVADESSLTGEPLPIRKFPLRWDDDVEYDRLGASKISTIFAGTMISQAMGDRVVGLVMSTGTATDKGQLVKKILFPTRVSFVFDEQIKIVILILLCCGVLCLGMAVWMVSAGTTAWFYSMFAIAQLVSPLLPAALVVGQSVAAGRLREKNIFCVDLTRILMAGKVQLFCFDKTGTLTKEGLEFYGAQPVIQKENTPYFGQRQDSIEGLPRIVQTGLASCHAVTTLNDRLIGNPVDIEMFRCSGWTLADKSSFVDTLIHPSSGKTMDVLKRYEFVHARMSMSVAVLDASTNKVHIFVKGAYEKIKDLVNPNSIPSDYDLITSNRAREGCYVLALAHREIDREEFNENWSRDDMEQDIDLVGLIVFKNQLKADTSEYIAELKAGDTRTIMITGDTALTGIYIARQCGMAKAHARFLLADYDAESRRVVWSDVDEPELLADPDQAGVELAVTGRAFEWLTEHDLIRKYLLKIRVFARMTPAGKVQCVQLHMERGITAMTGDGGNDCGALRAAHVGIAMSDAEASIVSPFSTNHRSVASCVELLREGRAALATSLTGYKYLILYGQVMMMLKIFTFYFSVSMSESIWIAVDVFITVFLTWAVSQSKAASRLAPQRPTAKLLGPQTLASGIGLVAINWIFLSSAYVLLFKQDWFRCNEFDSRAVDMSKWMLLSDNYEGEILALVCLFQFINNAAVFNFGYKFRQSFYKNYSLVFLWLLYLVIVSYWTLADPNRFGCLFRFNCGTPQVLEQIGYVPPSWSIMPYNTPLGHNVMPRPFRWRLWGLMMGNVATALVYEKFVVLGPVHSFLARMFPVNHLDKTL